MMRYPTCPKSVDHEPYNQFSFVNTLCDEGVFLPIFREYTQCIKSPAVYHICRLQSKPLNILADTLSIETCSN